MEEADQRNQWVVVDFECLDSSSENPESMTDR
jgi:hypothetical protein